MMMQYIKKEDAKNFIESRNKLLGFVVVAFSIVMGVIYLNIVPRMVELFMDTGRVLPTLVKFAPILTGVLLIIAVALSIRFFTTKINEVDFQQKLQNYKEGEMIRAGEILDMTNTYMTLGFVGISMLLFILTFIVPLYSI